MKKLRNRVLDWWDYRNSREPERERCERLGIEPREFGGVQRGVALALIFTVVLVATIAECMK